VVAGSGSRVGVSGGDAALLEAVRNRMLRRVKFLGDLYLADVHVPMVDKLVDADLALLDPPDGYVRAGKATHGTAMGERLVGVLDEEYNATGAWDRRYKRALLLSTIPDEAGDVHIATLAPCVRVAKAGPDIRFGLNVHLHLYPGAGPDGHLFSHRIACAGPGWLAHMRRLGVQL
jgi:hypothetical protein